MNHLATCSFCGEAVFRLTLETGPSMHPVDIDWRPWTIEDETPPTEDAKGQKPTAATLRRWAEERPYRLGLVVLHLDKGTYESAVDKPRGPRRRGTLHKLHLCEERERHFYGTSNKSQYAVGDQGANGSP